MTKLILLAAFAVACGLYWYFLAIHYYRIDCKQQGRTYLITTLAKKASLNTFLKKHAPKGSLYKVGRKEVALSRGLDHLIEAIRQFRQGIKPYVVVGH